MKRFSVLAVALLAVLAAVVWGFRPVATRFDGKTAEEWAAELGHLRPENRQRARKTLEAGGADAVSALIGVLRGDNALGRVGAAEILGTIRREASDAVPALLEALDHPDSGLRRAACRALTLIRPEDPAVVARFTEFLDHSDRTMRESALAALGRAGPAAAGAAKTLGRIGADRREKEGTRGTALMSLCGIGPDAASATADLEKTLKDPSPFLRSLAAGALGRIDPEHEEALIVLLQLLPGSWEDAGLAVMAIAEFGDRARPAIPLLKKHLEKAPVSRRALIAFALARIDEDPAPYVESITEILGIEDEATHGGAIVMLGCLGAAAAPAIPTLERLVEHEHLGDHAKAALRRIRGEEPVPTDLWTFSR